MRALVRLCISIRKQTIDRKTYLSAFCLGGKRTDVVSENISAAVKFAAGALDYPLLKGIPIEHVDTHYFHAGGANYLSLAGYINRYIKKMGVGGVKPSKIILGRINIVFQRECRQQ